MNKGQLIAEIQSLNPTAGEKFLVQFEAEALAQYLEHLKGARERLLRIHGWSRKSKPRQRLAS